MDSPKVYTNKQFMQNVINPALEELKSKNCFKNLICTVKYVQKRGRPVMGYIFTFEPEERGEQASEKQKTKLQKKLSQNSKNQEQSIGLQTLNNMNTLVKIIKKWRKFF